MNTITELAYIGRDNSIDLELREDGAAVDLSMVSRVRLELFDVNDESPTPVVIDSAITAGAFDFETDAGAGVIHIMLGAILAAEGEYRVRLVTFDPDNTAGLVWVHELGTGGCLGTVLTIRALDAQDAA